MTEFKIGQYVFYLPHNRFKAEGRYVVMRLLPRGTKGGALHHQKPDDAGARIHSRGNRTTEGPEWAMSLGPKRRLYIETKLIRSALLCHLSF